MPLFSGFCFPNQSYWLCHCWSTILSFQERLPRLAWDGNSECHENRRGPLRVVEGVAGERVMTSTGRYRRPARALSSTATLWSEMHWPLVALSPILKTENTHVTFLEDLISRFDYIQTGHKD
jgi:hypothetical protein